MSAEDIPARLEYLRGQIRAERISYGEISELQGLAAHIDAGDVELLQWAGVPEFPEDAPIRCAVCREPIELQGREWIHPHSGDTYCGTGDGATAYPVPATEGPNPGDTLETEDGRQLLVQYTAATEDGPMVYGRWIAEDGTIDALAAVPLDTLTEGD